MEQAKRPQPKDERRQPRHRTVKFVWYRLLDEGPQLPAEGEGVAHSCDLSVGGIGLYVTHKLPLGTKVFIEISTGEINLSAVGKVANVIETKEGYYRVGVAFVAVPPNDRVMLNQLFRPEEP